MASKNSKTDKVKAKPVPRQAELKRLARTEEACRIIMDHLFSMLRQEQFAQHELAGKYAVMASIHYRKIRNGKVLGAADFNAAVEVCNAAKRCLQEFKSDDNAAMLSEIARQVEAVLSDYQQLKSGQINKNHE